MAKITGLGMSVTVDNSAGAGKNISNDINDISFSTPRGMVDVTGLDKSGIERLLLLADGKVQIKGTPNMTADMSHDVFKTVPTTSVSRTVVIVVGGATLTMELMFSEYGFSRDGSGKLVFTATGENADGSVPIWS
jgi:hypothetical protein